MHQYNFFCVCAQCYIHSLFVLTVRDGYPKLSFIMCECLYVCAYVCSCGRFCNKLQIFFLNCAMYTCLYLFRQEFSRSFAWILERGATLYTSMLACTKRPTRHQSQTPPLALQYGSTFEPPSPAPRQASSR